MHTCTPQNTRLLTRPSIHPQTHATYIRWSTSSSSFPSSSTHSSGASSSSACSASRVYCGCVPYPLRWHTCASAILPTTITQTHHSQTNHQTHKIQVLKLSRYSSGGTLVWRTLKNSGPALGLITTFTIVLSFLVGSLIFYYEQGVFKVHADGADDLLVDRSSV